MLSRCVIRKIRPFFEFSSDNICVDSRHHPPELMLSGKLGKTNRLGYPPCLSAGPIVQKVNESQSPRSNRDTTPPINRSAVVFFTRTQRPARPGLPSGGYKNSLLP